jgi:hypothetical protein
MNEPEYLSKTQAVRLVSERLGFCESVAYRIVTEHIPYVQFVPGRKGKRYRLVDIENFISEKEWERRRAA